MAGYQGTSFTPELTPAGYALFRAGVKVSAGTCDDLAESLRRRHERNGTRWRLLSPLAQAVLGIALLRPNLTYAELAPGFGVSPATCWPAPREGRSAAPRPPKAAGEGGDPRPGAADPAAAPPPRLRGARERPPQVLENPGHRAAVPAGTMHRHGQGRPRPALHGTRPVRRPPRRVTRPDRYRDATPAPPAPP